MVFADFNRDGRPDLLGTSRTGNKVLWFANPRDPVADRWHPQLIDSETIAPAHAHAVDLDQDGDLDVLLAAGILGATVMPHVIYLHSALTKPRAHGRSEEERSRLIRFERVDVVIAMAIAGLVNMSMLIVAAAAFHSRGLTDVVDLEEVHALLGPILGSSAPVLFALALLASGLSSSSVGTLAGQVIMEGFIHRRIPLWLRRGITMAPAIAIIAIGVNPPRALIISQVILSFGIPFALIPLILASRDRGLMGRFRIGTRGLVAAVLVACVILALNVFLLGKLALG